jgi:NADH-quinone oxidoreductase subunit L
LFGALLTAFYMTRQVCYVFLGSYRGQDAAGHPGHASAEPHESPAVMTLPLVVLAGGAVLLGFIGTPAWPWFLDYLNGHPAQFDLSHLFAGDVLVTMGLSSLLALTGLGTGWWLYGRQPVEKADQIDVLERKQPGVFKVLRNKFYADELYEATVIRFNAVAAQAGDWLDRWIWNGLVQAVTLFIWILSWISRLADEYLVNSGFDFGCGRVRDSGRVLAWLQTGQVQTWLRVVGLAVTALVLYLIWA